MHLPFALAAWVLGCNGAAPVSDPKSDPSDPSTATPDPTTPPEPDVPTCDVALPGPEPTQEACWTVTHTLVVPEDLLGGFAPATLGHLTDDNGDETIGDGDITDWVVASTAFGRPAPVVQGNGIELFTLAGQYRSPFAILDADGDGVSDLLATAIHAFPDYLLELYDGAGVRKWTSSPLPSVVGESVGATSAGDFDGDGDLELIVGRWIVDGGTGLLERTLQLPEETWFGQALVADLDLDGTDDVIIGRHVFTEQDTPAWSVEVAPVDPYGTGYGVLPLVYPVLLALDADPQPELGFWIDGRLHRFEADGTAIDTLDVPAQGRSAPPCVADFDGDGGPELGLPAERSVAVVEIDGSVVWTAPTPSAGCSAADLDGDGSAELLVAGDGGFVIHDGPTGAVTYEERSLRGTTTPVVADVDGDGDAEIVVSTYDPTGASPSGYVVLDAAGWPGVSGQWGLVDFSEARLSADGAVGGADPAALRSRSTVSAGLPLRAEIVEVCDDTCDGPWAVSVRVQNLGREVAVAPVVEVLGDGVVLGSATVADVAPDTAGAAVAVPLDGPRGGQLSVRVVGGASCTPAVEVVDPCGG